MSEHRIGRDGARRGLRRLAVITRSIMLGAVVFTAATLTGVLLAGSTSAGPAIAPAQTPPASQTRPAAATPEGWIDATFARSLIYSGATALVVSTAGLVIVGRRRRLW